MDESKNVLTVYNFRFSKFYHIVYGSDFAHQGSLPVAHLMNFLFRYFVTTNLMIFNSTIWM